MENQNVKEFKASKQYSIILGVILIPLAVLTLSLYFKNTSEYTPLFIALIMLASWIGITVWTTSYRVIFDAEKITYSFLFITRSAYYTRLRYIHTGIGEFAQGQGAMHTEIYDDGTYAQKPFLMSLVVFSSNDQKAILNEIITRAPQLQQDDNTARLSKKSLSAKDIIILIVKIAAFVLILSLMRILL